MKPHECFKAWRKHKGLTQEQVSDRAEIDNTILSKLERGIVKYTQGHLEGLAHAYGVDNPADILNPPPSPDRPESELTAFLRKLKRREDQATALRILKAAFEKDGTNG